MLNYTIIISDQGLRKKITKLIIISDGSFALQCPYHNASKGYFMKYKIDYSQEAFTITSNEIVQEFVASHRVKLTVHKSGYVHFSGDNIRSGLDPVTGKPKGLGYYTSSLNNPISTGPTAGVQIWGLEDFQEPDAKVKKKTRIMEFSEQDFYYRVPASHCNAYLFEVFVIPFYMRSSIFRNNDSNEYIDIAYAFERVLTPLRLRVIRMENVDSFLGICVARCNINISAKSGYFLSGPGGGLSSNKGNMETVFACYPAVKNTGGLPSLDYHE